LYLVF